MRPTAILLLLGFAAAAQFRSTIPLVVAPTVVTDSRGQYVDGLTVHDLILYDNNVDDLSHRPGGGGPDQCEFRRGNR